MQQRPDVPVTAVPNSWSWADNTFVFTDTSIVNTDYTPVFSWIDVNSNHETQVASIGARTNRMGILSLVPNHAVPIVAAFL